jgi:hypothetical protein
MVEQLTCNQWVGGSIPFAGSSWGETGEVPERSKGADCKSAGEAFGGSNPPLSTRGTSQERLNKGFSVGVWHILFLSRRLLGACRSDLNAGIAQLARASAFQAEGRGFESRFPLHNSDFLERLQGTARR